MIGSDQRQGSAITDLVGVRLRPLDPHADDRGTFTEVFRAEWDADIVPVQWNVVKSEPGTLRGVHVHLHHQDYLTVVEGSSSIGLRDLRLGSATRGMVAVVKMAARQPAALSIPPGVAHGFLFHTPSIHMYAVSEYWDPADELGVRFDDAALKIPWPARPTRVSPRDLQLPCLEALLDDPRVRGVLG